MKKFLLAYFILFAFALQIGSRIYILVDFQINKEFIVENLCEKKDEPESCCEGSCHLAKELNKVEESENKGPLNSENTKKEKAEEMLGSCTFFSKFIDHSIAKPLIAYSNSGKTCSGFSIGVFRPPVI